MDINTNLADQYLKCGKTYDNYIIEGCNSDFINYSIDSLREDKSWCKSCCVVITDEDESRVEDTLSDCTEELHKKILARDYITVRIMQSVLAKRDLLGKTSVVNEQINAFHNRVLYKVKDYHGCFFPSDVAEERKNVGDFELNIFLVNSGNKLLQEAINLFISSREPYSVKLFTTRDRLSSYYDQVGNLIESPHDYTRLSSKMFLCEDMDKEK